MNGGDLVLLFGKSIYTKMPIGKFLRDPLEQSTNNRFVPGTFMDNRLSVSVPVSGGSARLVWGVGPVLLPTVFPKAFL